MNGPSTTSELEPPGVLVLLAAKVHKKTYSYLQNTKTLTEKSEFFI
jgi:hypothetical protein